MPKESLKATLRELHAALMDAEFKNPEDRVRLDALVQAIEAEAETPEPFAEDESIMGNLEETIGSLELEYPLATRLLQRIQQLARTLGAGGI